MSESTRELEKASRDAFKAGSLMMSGKVFKAAGSSFFKSCSSQSKDSLRMALLRKKLSAFAFAAVLGQDDISKIPTAAKLNSTKIGRKAQKISNIFRKNVSVVFF